MVFYSHADIVEAERKHKLRNEAYWNQRGNLPKDDGGNSKLKAFINETNEVTQNE